MTIKNQISKYHQFQLNQIKQLSEEAKAYRNRTKSVALRKEILDKQNIRNYQSEYERIRAHIDNSTTPTLTIDGLKSRAERLKQLGAKALDTIM